MTSKTRTSDRLRYAVTTPVLIGGMLTSMTMATPAGATPAPEPARVKQYAVAKRVTLKPKAARAALPVQGYRLTGRYGNVSGLWSSSHTGLDFATAYGAPIRSVVSGEVVSAGYDGAYGYKTVVRAKDGTEYWYCHQAAIEVSVGQRLVTGQVLGHVGMTGNVTGAHLHLEVRPAGGDPVDPYAHLVSKGLRP